MLSAPLASSGVHPLKDVEAGAVFVFNGNTLPPYGTIIADVTDNSSSHVLGTARHGRMGW